MAVTVVAIPITLNEPQGSMKEGPHSLRALRGASAGIPRVVRVFGKLPARPGYPLWQAVGGHVIDARGDVNHAIDNCG